MSRGRRTINIEPYKDELVNKYRSGTSFKDLVKWLKDDKNTKIEMRSLARRFSDWNVPKRKVWITESDDQDKLKEVMHPLVLQKLDDDKIVEQMKEQGFNVTMYHVCKLRKEMGMRRRHDPSVECDVCKKQGRYPKQGCPHQNKHQVKPQRKSAEVSKSLREEVKALKKQVRDLESETKRKDREHERLQKEIEKLKDDLKSATWQQQLLGATVPDQAQYEQYPESSRW